MPGLCVTALIGGAAAVAVEGSDAVQWVGSICLIASTAVGQVQVDAKVLRLLAGRRPDLDNHRVFVPVPGGTRLQGTNEGRLRGGLAGLTDRVIGWML